MKVGDLVRPWNARKAMGLVVEVINNKHGEYAVVQWLGKDCRYNRVYQQYKLEVAI
tara:strand:+ start:3009 stop:3176 length:168 start_codon:yes stop_codon:yes gene_type:complete